MSIITDIKDWWREAQATRAAEAAEEKRKKADWHYDGLSTGSNGSRFPVYRNPSLRRAYYVTADRYGDTRHIEVDYNALTTPEKDATVVHVIPIGYYR